MMRRAPRLLAALIAALALPACIPQVGRPDRAPPPTEAPQPPPRDEVGSDASTSGGEVAALPAPKPAWESRPVEAQARAIPASTYRVRSGDTLKSIAEETGAGEEAIARANDLKPPRFTIRSGQRLKIPAGRYHLVRPSESGIAIARAYGVEWSRIVEANDLTEPFLLRAGQRIVIPGTLASEPSRADRAAAFRLDIDDILTGGEPAVATNQKPAKPVASAARVLPPTAAVTPPRRFSGGAFLWPVTGRILKPFGPGDSGERNNGINISVPIGTPVRAASDGVVAYVGDGIAAMGGLVIIKHGGSWVSIYGHASKLLVQRGQAVKRGQTIALSGDTGYAQQPQVHFELRKGRTPVDPQRELRGV